MIVEPLAGIEADPALDVTLAGVVELLAEFEGKGISVVSAAWTATVAVLPETGVEVVKEEVEVLVGLVLVVEVQCVKALLLFAPTSLLIAS